MHIVLLLANLGAVLVLLLAATRDIISRRISNTLVCALLACAFAAALAEHRLATSAIAAVIVFALTLVMWLPGFIGGADAKLLTASSLLLAPAALPGVMACTAIAGGILCLPYILGARLFPPPSPTRPSGLLRRVLRCEQWRLRRRGPLPYAVAIAAGTIFTLAHGS